MTQHDASGSTPARERQLGDERSRYGRKSMSEQLGEVAELLLRYRVWVIAALVLVGVGAWLAVMSRNVSADRIAVGDCLYIPTTAAGDPTSSRPIGVDRDVEQVLHSGGAQEASCTASHGHEASAIVPLATNQATQDAFRTAIEPACDAAFPGFVGHALSGSAFVTFAAVPTPDQWSSGDHVGLCLVARADGQWMTSPARGSGG